jgi:ABC-type spermidine/putrescine transport system permease subunit II
MPVFAGAPDPDRLAAYQIPITNVRDALVRQNADLPGGNVTAGLNEASLRTMGRVAEPRAFNDLVVATLSGVPIRVRDIGYAEDGTKEQRSAARLNGVPTVIMEVRRQSGENTVAVIEGVKAKLTRLRAQVPPDVKLEVIRDQSRYIYAALHEINLHLVLGSILASLVVLAFMRSWRSTFIAAVAIPTSVVSAFGMMWAWLVFPIPIYGTLWVLLIAYLTVFLPLGVRTISSVLMQLDKSLDECGQVCGASWWYRMRTITAPLLRPGLLAAWLLIFVASVRELGASILRMGPDSKVMTPAIVEAWFSSSSELTAAMALIQTVVITATMVVFGLFTRRLAHHGASAQ